jgi:Bcr/CflA subfamily drug resistance transporter
MNSKSLLFFVIVLAACLTQFASDIYAPSLPAIATSLNTSIDYSQWSMAIYMYGVALTLLIYGPLSDGVGRKIPMLAGLSIMIVGSLICTFAPTIEMLVVGRFIQGCGAGACAGLWRSVFRDIFTGDELAKYGSYFTILIMFIVPAAPALGGYLQDFFGWRASFVFMSAYTVFALLTIIFGFKETSVHHHTDKLKLNYVIKIFRELLTSKTFIGMTFCTFLTYGAFFAWLTSGPVLLIKQIGIAPATFGLITFFGGGVAYALAGVINGKVVKRFGMPNMMRFGWSIMILSGILMLAGKFFIGLNVWVIVIPMVLLYFGSTFIWPNAFATAFTPFGHIAGYAGALYGFMQISGGAVMSTLVTYLPDNNQVPLAMIILFCSMIAWSVREFIERK